MGYRSLAAAVVVTLGVTVSGANATTIPQVSLQDLTNGYALDLSNYDVAKGSFSKNYEFTYTGSSDQGTNVGASVTQNQLTFRKTLIKDITGLSISFGSIGPNNTYTQLANNSEITSTVGANIALAAGKTYAFVVSGTADGTLGGQYSGTAYLSAVPIPATVLLFGSGLVGLVGFGRRSMKARAAA